MMRNIFFGISVLLVLLCTQSNYSASQLNLQLKNIPLSEAIYLLSAELKQNVIINAKAEQMVSINVSHSSANAILDLLLKTNGYVKWKNGQDWVVMTLEEAIKLKQNQSFWRQTLEENAVLQTKIWQLNYLRAADLAHHFENNETQFLSKRGKFFFDQRANQLYIRDVPDKIIALDRLIKRLDIPMKQIAIEAKIISLDADYEKNLGLRYDVLKRATGEIENSEQKPAQQINFAIARLADNMLLDIKLSALENEGHAELISRPKLMTASAETAVIESGEEVPYQETSEGGGTAVSFKKAVLSLKATPEIMPHDRILLKLQMNQDRPSNRIVQGVPTISTRQIMTSVVVKNGETVVLGGIYEDSDENNRERIPFLQAVPLLGQILQFHSHHKSKRELLIFVTPRMINS